jgi:hypothetical protein
VVRAETRRPQIPFLPNAKRLPWPTVVTDGGTAADTHVKPSIMLAGNTDIFPQFNA